MTAKQVAKKLIRAAKIYSKGTGIPLADSLLLMVQAVANGSWNE